MTTTVKFGLIGYGAWGSYHARAIAGLEGAALVAIAAHSEASCERAAIEHPNVRVYPDYREMLKRERMDAVDVVVPSHLHHAIGRDVLAAGGHLLLEKPMALSVQQCTDLIEFARGQGRKLAVGHELRLSSLWGKVKRMIEAGDIGEPMYALIELWRRPYRLGADGWRYDINRVGDWILEEPIHFFDLARWYFAGAGEPQTVFAQANGIRPDHPELQDNFSAIVGFPRGKYAVITQTLAGWQHHQTVKLTGTSGALWASWSGAMDRTLQPTYRLEWLRGGQLVEVPLETPSGEVYELAAEIAAFADAVRKRVPVSCTGEDGRWSVAMCLAARESLLCGRPVALRGGSA